MYEHQSWRKCRGLIFREYLKYCVPPLFQSVFNLTKGRGFFFCFGITYSRILSKLCDKYSSDFFGQVGFSKLNQNSSENIIYALDCRLRLNKLSVKMLPRTQTEFPER